MRYSSACSKTRSLAAELFIAKVAMAALQGDKTLAELASEYDVRVNQVQTWRNQLKDMICH